MKIGIFAGTFDPIHNGHIEFARTATEQAGLDKIIIVAEKEPYRKKPHASWDHRQAMIERASQPLENIDHDYQFANQLAHQHTMKNMLEVAKKHFNESNEFWFLVGSDLFEHMHQWHDLAAEHEYGGFVVALRDGHTLAQLNQQQERLKQVAGRTTPVVVVPNAQPHISSSAIRSAIKSNLPISDVPASVQEYLQTHQLYQ